MSIGGWTWLRDFEEAEHANWLSKRYGHSSSMCYLRQRVTHLDDDARSNGRDMTNQLPSSTASIGLSL